MQEVLRAARRVFSSAASFDYSSLDVTPSASYSMLSAKEAEELRWFLLPHDANLHLKGTPPPPVHIPFSPKTYQTRTGASKTSQAQEVVKGAKPASKLHWLLDDVDGAGRSACSTQSSLQHGKLKDRIRFFDQQVF